MKNDDDFIRDKEPGSGPVNHVFMIGANGPDPASSSDSAEQQADVADDTLSVTPQSPSYAQLLQQNAVLNDVVDRALAAWHQTKSEERMQQVQIHHEVLQNTIRQLRRQGHSAESDGEDAWSWL